MVSLKYIRSAFVETLATTLSPLTVFVWVAGIVMAVVSGPFGTMYSMEWPLRLIFWTIIITGSIVAGVFVRAVALGAVGPDRPVAFDSLSTLLMTLVFGPLVWMFTRIVEVATGMPILSFLYVMGYGFLVSAVVFVLRRLIPGFEEQVYSFLHTEPEMPVIEPVDPDPSISKPRLLRRLPKELGDDILCLSGRGHYVEVTTAKGKHTLRIRLADAIDEMEAVPGLCVHRSHWIAKTSVVRVQRESAQKIYLILKNGDSVPISRKYQPSARASGLLD